MTGRPRDTGRDLMLFGRKGQALLVQERPLPAPGRPGCEPVAQAIILAQFPPPWRRIRRLWPSCINWVSKPSSHVRSPWQKGAVENRITPAALPAAPLTSLPVPTRNSAGSPKQ